MWKMPRPIVLIVIFVSLGALVAVPGYAAVSGDSRRAGESQSQSTLASSADFSFAQTYVDEDYGGNGKPGFSLAADMDGDDDVDIVAGGGGALFVYENDGTAGGWTRHGSLDGSSNIGANGAVLYDVDDDGHIDVVAALYTDDLGWWENPGGALSSTAWTFHQLDGDVTISGWFAHDVIRGDLDDDGTAEEFVFALQNGYWNAPYHLYWYRPGADPTAAWDKHIITYNHSGANNNHAGIDLADLDADDDVDVIFSNGWSDSEASRMDRHIIRKIRLAHCKRGPERCEKCRAMDAERICLLDVCLPDAGMMQRRVIQLTIDGEEVWREFDVVKVFENEQEASDYARENDIQDAEF